MHRILVLAANPEDSSPLRLGKEVQAIKEGLRRSRHSHRFDVESEWAVGVRELRRALLDHRPEYVHFSGHGTQKGIVLEDEFGTTHLVRADALSDLFSNFAGHVGCVLLNACHSQPQAKAISRVIRYAIGMRGKIGDEAAIEFATGFYDAVGAGREIADAFAIGRSAIRTAGLPGHTIPVLNRWRGQSDGPMAAGGEHETPSSDEPRAVPPEVPTLLPIAEFPQPHPATSFGIPDLPPQRVRGRTAVLNQLIRLLRLDETSARDVGPVALWGMGGVGKTTAVNAFVHHVGTERRFPDGIVWVTLGPEPHVGNLLNRLGHHFQVDLVPEPDDDERVKLLRKKLYHRRALLVVDDVWEARHGRYFLLTGPLGRTILTTRESLVAFPLATRRCSVRVRELSPSAALAMLGELAPEAVHQDREAAAALCRSVEYLPLAIKLAGGMLALEADVPGRMHGLMKELAERREARLALQQDEPRLGLDPDKPASLEAILGMSVDRLDDTDRRRFALLSVFGGEPLFWILDHAAVIWECSPDAAAATTSRLIQRGLVERRGEEYWMHALLNDYAAGLRLSVGL